MFKKITSILFAIIVSKTIAFSNIAKTISGNLSFTENKGQFYNPLLKKHVADVLFKASVGGFDCYVTTKGLSYNFYQIADSTKINYSRVDAELEGAHIESKNIITEGEQSYVYNYYSTINPEGITGVRSFKKIIVKNIYTGIDWLVYINEKNNSIKYDFVVHPGASVEQIKIIYKGQQKIKLTDNANFNIASGLGNINEGDLYCYNDKTKKAINSRYKINGNTVTFDVLKKHDETLVIDPSLVWSTHWGGATGAESIKASAVDDNNNLLVGGVVNTYGGGGGSYMTTYNPGGGAYYVGSLLATNFSYDAYFGKFSSAGILTWATFYGSNPNVSSASGDLNAITCDHLGNLYAAGMTQDPIFPTFNPGNGAYFNGTYSNPGSGITYGMSYILRFNPSGQRTWATYFTNYRYIGTNKLIQLSTDSQNRLYITGFGRGAFPIVNRPGAYNRATISSCTGVDQSTIALFDSNANQIWGTYFTNASTFGDINIWGSAVDSQDNFYIIGNAPCNINSDNIPIVDPGNGAYMDANQIGINGFKGFICRFNSAGTITWSTTFAGSYGSVNLKDISIDEDDNIFIIGSTNTTNIPTLKDTTCSYLQTAPVALNDYIIAKFNNNAKLKWCTYYGSSIDEFDRARISAKYGYVSVLLPIQNFASDFPLYNPGSPFYYNAATTNARISTLLQFTNKGIRTFASLLFNSPTTASNSWPGVGEALSCDKIGNTYISGNTYIDLTTFNPGSGAYFQPNNNGEGYDGFIMKLNSVNPILNFTTSQTNPICNGSATGSITVTTTGGIAPFTYTWSTGATTASISTLAANSYTVTVSDAFCSNATSVITITQPSAINFTTPTINDATCGLSNGIATVNASGGTGVLGYSWSATETSATINNKASGSYVVTVTDVNSCSATLTVNIGSIGGATISSVTKNNALCFGGNGNATVNISNGVSGNYTYLWSNGASTVTTTNSNQELLTANSYTVTVIDGACSTTTVVSISEPSAITFSTPTINNATCGISNGSASVAASGGTGALGYSWSATELTNSITNKAAGAYVVTVTDVNSCTNTLTVNIGSIGGATISSVTKNDANCFGGNGNATVNISGGVSVNYTYSWSNGSSTVTTATSNQELLSSNSYTVTVIDGACSTTTVVNITQPSAITFGTPTINNASCGISNGNATVAASGGTGTLNYSWSANETSATISNKTSGSYIVTITDVNSCSATLAVNIGSIGGATISSVTKNDANCFGGNGNATVNISGGVSGNYTYSWSNGASAITTATSNTQLLSSNSYTVTVIDGACSTTTVVNITQPTPLAIGINKTNASCAINNGSITAAVSNGTANYTFVWSAALGYNNTSNSSGVNIINNLTADTYSLIVTDNNNCSAATTVTIINSGNPSANASASAYEIEEGASTLLTASGGTSYLWTPPTALSCTNCPNPSANPNFTTTYTLVVRDIFGCIDSTDITIKVNKSCTDEKDVFIPNVFSPNNDGKNDVLKIEGNGLTNIYWSIYDRWGNLVFESRNQDNGWDGTVNGNTANAGTYVYYLKATCKKTLQEIILKGNVSVVK